MSSEVSEFVLATSLSVCAVADLKDHRIPNSSLAAGCVAVLGALIWDALECGGWSMAVNAVSLFWGRLALAGILGFPFFLLRMTGAGDVKMMAVIVAALGGGRGAAAVGIGLCLGAVLALGRMLRYGSICQRFLYLFAYIGRVFRNKTLEAYYLPERDGTECVIPLGACFWAGALAVILWME